MLKKLKPADENTEKNIDYAVLIDQAHTEQNRLTNERDQAQARIDQAQTGIDQARARIADRTAQLQELERRVSLAERTAEKQESYVALTAGRAGASELEGQRATLRDLHTQRAQQDLAIADGNHKDEQLIGELERKIQKDSAAIRGLERKIAQSGGSETC